MTHLCLALANYCSSKYGCKTACLELHTSTAFSRLASQNELPLEARHIQASNYFTIYGVDYYPQLSHQEIPDLMNAGYHYLILDFGVITECDFHEFIRCKQKLVVGSLSPWKQESFYGFFQHYNLEKLRESFLFLLLYGNQTDIWKLSKETKTPRKYLQGIPFFENPFHIEKEQFLFLEKLLN